MSDTFLDSVSVVSLVGDDDSGASSRDNLSNFACATFSEASAFFFLLFAVATLSMSDAFLDSVGSVVVVVFFSIFPIASEPDVFNSSNSFLLGLGAEPSHIPAEVGVVDSVSSFINFITTLSCAPFNNNGLL